LIASTLAVKATSRVKSFDTMMASNKASLVRAGIRKELSLELSHRGLASVRCQTRICVTLSSHELKWPVAGEGRENCPENALVISFTYLYLRNRHALPCRKNANGGSLLARDQARDSNTWYPAGGEGQSYQSCECLATDLSSFLKPGEARASMTSKRGGNVASRQARHVPRCEV
jgi:hypothetical protein